MIHRYIGDISGALIIHRYIDDTLVIVTIHQVQ